MAPKYPFKLLLGVKYSVMFSEYKITSQINAIPILIICVNDITGSVCSAILGYDFACCVIIHLFCDVFHCAASKCTINCLMIDE